MLWQGLGGRVMVAVVAAVVGFLLISQLQGEERFTQRLEEESEGDLARILAGLNAQADALQDEIAVLREQLFRLDTSTRRDEAAVAASQRQLEALSILAGTVPVEGPGVSVSIHDPEAAVGYDAVIDVVQELRDAGAEALAVNGSRIGVSSAFSEAKGEVLLDGEPLARPFRIEAIGEPETLEGGLAIPGGAVDTLEASRGVDVTVTRRSTLQLPAQAEAPDYEVARPVGS